MLFCGSVSRYQPGPFGCQQHEPVEANAVLCGVSAQHGPREEEVWSSRMEHPLRVQPGRLQRHRAVHSEPPRGYGRQTGGFYAFQKRFSQIRIRISDKGISKVLLEMHVVLTKYSLLLYTCLLTINKLYFGY